MTDITPIVFDLETAAHPRAASLLSDDDIQADKRLTDPVKIAADIARKKAERESKLGLDPNTSRIVALGYWIASQGTQVITIPDETQEREALEFFWAVSHPRLLMGYNCVDFDIPHLIRRSQLLGVRPRYTKAVWRELRDVYDVYVDGICMGNPRLFSAIPRDLKTSCRVFDVPTQNDSISGADIQTLVNAGDWEAISAHCRADVELTVGLAKKLSHLREAA
jgi:DNA polymerase elongation subunit (family B)